MGHPIFDHLSLDSSVRALIATACGDASSIKLSQLDKGLSGASVWLGKWLIAPGSEADPHVFKVGKKNKLCEEYNAVINIASPIDRLTPRHDIFYHQDFGDLAVLRQEFVGDGESLPKSLRQYIIESSDLDNLKKLFVVLYKERMQKWHTGCLELRSFGDELQPWTKKIDLQRVAQKIGYMALNLSLKKYFQSSVEEITNIVKTLTGKTYELQIGPAHGDLHAQNVLVSSSDRIHLIDFGRTGRKWRNIDFIMMECSLKFMIVPASARFKDMLLMEEVLEKFWFDDAQIQDSSFSDSMYANDLLKVGECIRVIRKLALDLGAVQDIESYRIGLIILTAGLTRIPVSMNTPYLFHNIAFHIERLKSCNKL